jgi:circadian clock protein KaiB
VNAESKQGESAVPALTLLVTGNAPRSRRARTNLTRALKVLDQEAIKPLEVDLLSQPEQSVSYSVFATPALLMMRDDGEVAVLYGDLSNERKLLDFLGDIGQE